MNAVVYTDEPKIGRSYERDRGVTSLVVNSMQQLLMAWVSSATNAHTENYKSFFTFYGINRELTARVTGVSIVRLERACNYQARKLLAKPDQGELTLSINPILESLVRELDEEKLIDDFILAGASNTILAETFGLRACVTKVKREMLGYVPKPGRKNVDRGMDTFYKISNVYFPKLKTTKDKRRLWLDVADETGFSLDCVYRVINDIIK